MSSASGSSKVYGSARVKNKFDKSDSNLWMFDSLAVNENNCTEGKGKYGKVKEREKKTKEKGVVFRGDVGDFDLYDASILEYCPDRSG